MLTRLQRECVLVEMEYTGKSLKAQLRRADKMKTRRVLILGEDELERGVAQLRNMDTPRVLHRSPVYLPAR